MLDLTRNIDFDAADHLDAAADYIEAHGWCQGAMFRDEGKACAVGAIQQARDLLDHPNYGGAQTGLVRWITGEVAFPGCRCGQSDCKASSIVAWNDAPGRTQHDVVTGMRKAAISLREIVR